MIIEPSALLALLSNLTEQIARLERENAQLRAALDQATQSAQPPPADPGTAP